MYELGIQFHDGTKTPRDYTKAMAWYRRATDLGHAWATTNLGLMYYFGRLSGDTAGPPDFPKAMEYFRMGSTRGDPIEEPTTGVSGAGRTSGAGADCPSLTGVASAEVSLVPSVGRSKTS
jgi:hypothetical protein